MTLPIAEQVLQAIFARLQTISVATGYNTDVQTVRRSTATISEEELPAIVLWCSQETTDEGNGKGYSMTMQLALEIDAFVTADIPTTGMQLELIKADIKRALLADDWSTGAGMLTYTAAQSVPRPEGRGIEAVALQFTASYKEKRGDPTAS